MSTTYTLFTEVRVADRWYCINPRIRWIDSGSDLPQERAVLVPTYQTNARHYFEKHIISCAMTDTALVSGIFRTSCRQNTQILIWISVNRVWQLIMTVFVGYLGMQRKEHYAFALREDVTAYANGSEEDIYEYVSIIDYREMDEELKKAYQYYEWNDSHGVHRFYSEIQERVDHQLRDWRYVNEWKETGDIRLVLFIR